ncbi:MAG: hypothetical protein WA964_14340 [Ilumatobacter sp.]|uniref:hypothetical protein n=1 Tax=Ilumatobacter sp. TaxID=1967498 RepID=UPI003C70BBAB
MALRHDASVVSDLRRARRERRLGDTEWFDVLYRVYLFALVGTIAMVVASDNVSGLLDDDVSADQFLSRGPAIAGLVAMFALGVGLRNGADGGPVSVESADVRHLLLAPVSRRRVMLSPIAQRLRSVAFPLALGFGVLGQLVAREIDSSRGGWAAGGALFGVVVASLYVAGAVVAHAVRLPRWLATIGSTAVVAWQGAAAWDAWNAPIISTDGRPSLSPLRAPAFTGPANPVGSIAFWGERQRGVDVLALAVVAALVVAALLLGGRLRLEPLERRGQLVSQLRFAATVQDIRTVVQLRRQLRAETMRARPWLGFGFGRPDGTTAAPSPRGALTRGRPQRGEPSSGVLAGFVWKRGLIAIARLSVSRLLRISGLAAVAGACASWAVTSSPLLLIPMVAAAFLLGLESIEPLAQEVDRPDLTDSIPRPRGWVFAHHLVAPAGLLAVAGLVAALAATVVDPAHAGAAFGLAIPLTWTGAIGGVVAAVKDAPDPPALAGTTLLGGERGAESPFAMPEFAGFSSVGLGALPVVLSGICALPVLALRYEPTFATVWRSILGVALCLAVTIWWVVRRDRWGASIRAFFVEGRNA